MNSLSYRIVIKTPIGYRIGNITIDIENEKISGSITAPFFEPFFFGTFNKDGTMLLMLTVNVDGVQTECNSTGRISGYAVHISVPTEKFIYEIDGTAGANK